MHTIWSLYIYINKKKKVNNCYNYNKDILLTMMGITKASGYVNGWVEWYLTNIYLIQKGPLVSIRFSLK